jgi:ATP-dependent protease ClpP protease subunit
MTKNPTNIRGRKFSVRAEAGIAEVFLYDAIDSWGGISAKQFADEIKALGEVMRIDLRINSPGGDIGQGMAIYSILNRQDALVVAHVDGIAASMASIIAMAADEIVMSKGAYMMIHNPAGLSMGDADDMRHYADLLDKMKGQLVNIYAERSKQSCEDIAALMDEETWFTADEAIAGGFADRCADDLAIAASLDASIYKNLPEALRKRGSGTQLKGIIMSTENQKTPEQIRAELLAETKNYSDRFGAELAQKWGPLGENRPLLDCYAEFVAQIRASHESAMAARDATHAAAIADVQTKLAESEKKVADLDSRLASISLGEKTGVSSGEVKEKPKGNKYSGIGEKLGRFAESIRLPGENN